MTAPLFPGRGESTNVVDSQQPRPGTDTRCRRSDLPTSMCAHCRGLDGVEVDVVDLDEPTPLGRPGADRWQSAAFYSTCGCGAQIVPGDSIRRVAGRYVCEVCGDA